MEFTPGPWRIGRLCDALVSDSEQHLPSRGEGSKKYYGGYLIAESIAPQNAELIRRAPEMYNLLVKISRQYPNLNYMITSVIGD